jgi:predicted nucleotidyltransferase
MKSISSLDQLDVPEKYKKFLAHFLANLAKVESVNRVILFGSCARGQVRDRSDIDLMVVTDKELPLDDEFHIMFDCPPNFDDELYIESDVLVKSTERYDKYKTSYGAIQRVVEREGVDLSELI